MQSGHTGGVLRKPYLLVLDQLKAHRTTAIMKMGELKIKLTVILVALTSQLQPLDASVNKYFKQNMHEYWNKRMTEPPHDLTPTGRMNLHTIAQVSEWANKYWDDVKPEIIVKSFRKCHISNVLDCTEDDVLFEVSDSSSRDEDENFSGFEDEVSNGYEDDQSVSLFSYCVLDYVQGFSTCVMGWYMAFTNICLNTLKAFYPESDLLKWMCILYASASYMPPNTSFRTHNKFFRTHKHQLN